jgi:hypothetical protein
MSENAFPAIARTGQLQKVVMLLHRLPAVYTVRYFVSVEAARHRRRGDRISIALLRLLRSGYGPEAADCGGAPIRSLLKA